MLQTSDDSVLEIPAASYTTLMFSNNAIPAEATVLRACVYVEHFENADFPAGKLQWTLGTGWPEEPVRWATINAPERSGKRYKAVDAWDVTTLIDSLERINAAELQIANSCDNTEMKTFIDHVYVTVEWR